MTDQTDTPEEATAVRIGGGASKRDTTHDVYPFYLGDDDTIMTGNRPPMATLLELVAGMTDDTDMMAQAATFNRFLGEVMDDESEAYLRKRLNDRDDELDLDHPDIAAMFTHLVEVWYGTRPTGGRGGSSVPSSRTGKRSTARSRSKG